MCMPVGSRMECMAASMDLWKLIAAHCVVRSCLPSLCAISLVTAHFDIGSERFLATCTTCSTYVYSDPAVGFIGHPREPASDSECDICKRGYVQLAAGPAGAVIGAAMGRRYRVASDVSVCACVHSPYGHRRRVVCSRGPTSACW
jgi:hypothetical protein